MKSLLRRYFELGSIISPLPFTILNGQAVDATPVMADLNAIVAAVNANAAPLTSLPVFTGITAFTPTLTIGLASTGITYGVQAGAYFKLSNAVFFSIDILLTSKGALVGNVDIGGLPFPVAAGFPTGSSPMCYVAARNVNYSNAIAGLFTPGASRLGLLNVFVNGPFGLITNVELNNNSEFIFTGFYST